MEKIDLNNYEAYFLDYMEGTLSAEEKHDLFAFLELHPQLRAEMEEDFGVVELMPEKVLFTEKKALKIDEAELILTPTTVDDLMIASVENQLSEVHKKQLEAYIKSQGLEKTYAYYSATVLKADTSIRYEEKEQLKVKTGIVISLPWVTRVASIAAVGIILITLGVNNWNGPSTIDSNQIENSVFAENSKDRGMLDAFKKVRRVNQMEQEGVTIIENEVLPNTYNSQPSNFENELIHQDVNNTIAEQNGAILKDTAAVSPGNGAVPNQMDNNPDNDVPQDDFAQDVEPDKEQEDKIVPVEYPENDIILASNKTEEPYKIVTDMAESIVNRDVEFTREKDVASNGYVGYGFKLGKFEFERKKSR